MRWCGAGLPVRPPEMPRIDVPVTAYVGLGSNVGDRASHLTEARTRLRPLGDITATSGVYETEPWGVPGPQRNYLNQVVQMETRLTPRALLAALLGVEAAMGRTRAGQGAPRMIDLDLLLYGDLVLAEPGLSLPHPRMHLRAFVLAPLAEIAPLVSVPGTGRTARELAEAVGPQGVTPWTSGEAG